MLADSGQFQEDLFYRIDVLRLDIPALRERGAEHCRHGRMVDRAAGQQIGDDDQAVSSGASNCLGGTAGRVTSESCKTSLNAHW